MNHNASKEIDRYVIKNNDSKEMPYIIKYEFPVVLDFPDPMSENWENFPNTAKMSKTPEDALRMLNQ